MTSEARAVDATVDLAIYTLRLADDALVCAQRLGEWIAAAPQLEEDVALANIALDELGQARSLLSYAGDVEGAGRDEDALAYLRTDREFVNAQLFELPNGDFGRTIARLLVTSSYQFALYDRLQYSSDETLAAIAAKAVKEVDYHRDHATQWVLRLGDGTDESHRRMQAGLDDIWPYVAELFEPDAITERIAAVADDGGRAVGVDPTLLEPPTMGHVREVLAEATLVEPQTRVRHGGGRRGVHTEALGYLLAEMQVLHRAHPGAVW